MRSLIVAEEMMTVPILLFNKFRSINILLITGRAEMERAVPMNNANVRILLWLALPNQRNQNYESIPHSKRNSDAQHTGPDDI